MIKEGLSKEARTILLADATLLLVAFLWGTGVPFTTNLVRTLTPIWGSTIRMVIAGIAMLCIYPGHVRRARPVDIRNGFIMALFVSAIFTLVGFALVISTPSKQSFFMGTSVLMVPFLAWLVNKKKPAGCVFLGAGLAMVGIIVMGSTPGMRFNFGDFLNLVMCFLSALHVIVIEKLVRQTDPTTLIAMELPLVGVIMVIIACIFEPIPDFANIPPIIWAQSAFTGLITTVAAFVLQAHAQKRTSASHAAIILATESVFGFSISVLTKLDPFILQGAIGGMIIVFGVIVSELDTILEKKG